MQLIRVPRFMSMTRLIRMLAAMDDRETVLEVPWGARAFRNPIDLSLLSLFTREHNIQVSLVVPDIRLIQLAAESGLPAVLNREREAAATASAAAGEQAVHFPHFHLPLPILIGTALLFLLGMVVMLWPRPILEVTAARRSLSLAAKAQISPRYKDGQIPDGRLPVQVVSKTDSIVVELAASGSSIEGLTPARGRATLLNDGSERLLVPAGTVLLGENNQRYRTEAAVTVPEAKYEKLLGIRISTTSGRAVVDVVAEEAGTGGNLAPGRLTKIEGPLGNRLRVINPESLTGGTDQRVAVVTEEDVERAQMEARRRMELEAPDALRALVGTDQIFLDELVTINPGQSAVTPEVGEQSKSVRVTLPYEAFCFALPQTVLAKFLEAEARKQAPTGFVVASRETFTVQGLVASPRGPDVADIEVAAGCTIIGRLNRGRIMDLVKGRTGDDARQALLALPEIAAVRFGDFGARLPRFAWMIRLVLHDHNG